MHVIAVDWTLISCEREMWDVLCQQGKEPAWHGRNLDALNDSWVSGGIGEAGPPYRFRFLNCTRIIGPLAEAAAAVMEIARASVAENGGSYSAEP
jgi:hypothetical protein